MYTVVFADDEVELRQAILQRIDWEGLGFSVVADAENGVEALEAVEQHEPDLLITDIRMPLMTGIELARRVREVCPATQIVFLSGYDDFGYAQEAIRYNVISYLLKPISAAELSEELGHIRAKMDARLEELRHAESYLVIQSYRYRDRFAYSFEIDESLLDCLCNKITIQPLIENAIYHGIGNMPDDGVITVRVFRDPEAAAPDAADILIEVEDNGVGMTEAQCAAILKKERSDSSGIGIKNVNDRLKIFFGDKYGISIRSELDAGTCVTVRLPRVEKETDV